jgi:hypothetical protein
MVNSTNFKYLNGYLQARIDHFSTIMPFLYHPCELKFVPCQIVIKFYENGLMYVIII